jgi:hypothetical protein
MLLESAAKLTGPSPEVAEEFERAEMRLAAEVNRRLGSRSDLERLIGRHNRRVMETNNRGIIRFLAALFWAYRPEILVENVLWALRRFGDFGFRSGYWAISLGVLQDVVNRELSCAAAAEVTPILRWFLSNLGTIAAVAEEDAAPSGPQPGIWTLPADEPPSS